MTDRAELSLQKVRQCLRRINDTLTLNYTAINVEKEKNINYR